MIYLFINLFAFYSVFDTCTYAPIYLFYGVMYLLSIVSKLYGPCSCVCGAATAYTQHHKQEGMSVQNRCGTLVIHAYWMNELKFRVLLVGASGTRTSNLLENLSLSQKANPSVVYIINSIFNAQLLVLKVFEILFLFLFLFLFGAPPHGAGAECEDMCHRGFTICKEGSAVRTSGFVVSYFSTPMHPNLLHLYLCGSAEARVRPSHSDDVSSKKPILSAFNFLFFFLPSAIFSFLFFFFAILILSVCMRDGFRVICIFSAIGSSALLCSVRTGACRHGAAHFDLFPVNQLLGPLPLQEDIARGALSAASLTSSNYKVQSYIVPLSYLYIYKQQILLLGHSVVFIDSILGSFSSASLERVQEYDYLTFSLLFFIVLIIFDFIGPSTGGRPPAKNMSDRSDLTLLDAAVPEAEHLSWCWYVLIAVVVLACLIMAVVTAVVCRWQRKQRQELEEKSQLRKELNRNSRSTLIDVPRSYMQNISASWETAPAFQNGPVGGLLAPSSSSPAGRHFPNHNPLQGSRSFMASTSSTVSLTALFSPVTPHAELDIHGISIAIPRHMTSEEYAALNDATPVPSCDSPEAGPWYHARSAAVYYSAAPAQYRDAAAGLVSSSPPAEGETVKDDDDECHARRSDGEILTPYRTARGLSIFDPIDEALSFLFLLKLLIPRYLVVGRSIKFSCMRTCSTFLPSLFLPPVAVSCTCLYVSTQMDACGCYADRILNVVFETLCPMLLVPYSLVEWAATSLLCNVQSFLNLSYRALNSKELFLAPHPSASEMLYRKWYIYLFIIYIWSSIIFMDL
eukprot:gene2075-1256_t